MRAPRIRTSAEPAPAPLARTRSTPIVAAPGTAQEREADHAAAGAIQAGGTTAAPLRAASAQGSAAPAIVDAVLAAPGHPLDAATRAGMEQRFGHDFSRVRVHDDTQASQSARAVKAEAYTSGSHIAFRAGAYRPDTDGGQRLLAHELAHVVQQSRVTESHPLLQRRLEGDDPKPVAGASVQIVSGSKPRRHQHGEQKIFGGKMGGHVVINLGDGGVLGFSNDEYGGHFFSKRKSKRNSTFEHYTQEEWKAQTDGKQVVTFSLNITPEQQKAIADAYAGEPDVDYSVLGYRCASYALHALDKAGVVDEADFKIKYFLAVTPGSLVRFLEKQGFPAKVQPGSKRRKWNTRFRKPDATQ